jgi:hypothetical protein
MVCTSPATEVLNSKIGVGSSLIAAIFEFYMPTLCCTAPEIPNAM